MEQLLQMNCFSSATRLDHRPDLPPLKVGHRWQFDITSLSSYAELIDYVEWGYNRDEERLPPINFGVLYAEQAQLPLHYQLYPGSLPDVTTLKNILTYLEFFQLTQMLLVLDRGFYSASNLFKMHQAKVKFIIPMPTSVKPCKVDPKVKTKNCPKRGEEITCFEPCWLMAT